MITVETGVQSKDVKSRRSIRLKEYNYSQSGYYFVTVCARGRDFLFGDIVDGEMVLNEYGKILASCWHDLPDHYDNVELDRFIIMPNHVHAIIIVGAGLPRPNTTAQGNIGREDRAPTLGQIVAYYKYGTTKQINKLRNAGIKKIWQRNYYEHVIRNDNDLTNIREYIVNNTSKWQDDEYYIK